ncbi:hypothetical protein R1T16_11195 [Flavobacterium sp. DG1-102-2]|uniref:hypothetical protein n=1 Tax=Flavobacterium sp. DG1-102-2 TaxID=3081663 RepID=UPI002948D81B|nr:hypothetical protein [Flavobacterium sp. DG1-102-2]MDV6168994.1 hypothetical protein [Flavobacterium sp. DG1-102-2]
MKRKYFFTLGAATLLLLGSCGPKLHRYGCGGTRRCISHVETAKNTAERIKQQSQTKDV